MRYVIFGESHGPAIGVALEGVAPGLELDLDQMARELARRATGKNPWSTARKEADVPEILSGLFEGRTTAPRLCAVIANTDTRSRDYAKLKDLPRPGHGTTPAMCVIRGATTTGAEAISPAGSLRRWSLQGRWQAAAGAEGSPGGRPHLQRGGHPGPHAGAV